MVDSPTLHRHNRRIRDLTTVLRGELRHLHPTQPGFVESAMAVITQYGQAAAVLGAELYETLRTDAGREDRVAVSLAGPPPVGQVAGSLRWATSRAASNENEDPAATGRRVEGVAQRLVLQAERDTIADTAERDPQAVGWARVPDADPCAFCAMLASRGPVYRTRQTATGHSGRAYHDECSCACVPVFGRDWPGRDRYERYERLWTNATGGHSGRDALTAFRRAVENRTQTTPNKG